MGWSGANSSKRHRYHHQKKVTESHDTSRQSAQVGSDRKSTETVEAALSRLSKAYTTSMECIGALKQGNSVIQKNPRNSTPDAIQTLHRVANAARSTMETGILMDPLILPYVSTTNRAMTSLHEQSNVIGETRWSSLDAPRPTPPPLASAAHRNKCMELAYLTLINYSDLLQTCHPLDPVSTDECSCILNKGVVKRLQVFVDSKHKCWEDEPEEETQRLVLTALCDASKLDDTDPVMWLKLACASRGLEAISLQSNPSSLNRSKHRRLQRYALERGSTALPPHVPPNRLVSKALAALQADSEENLFESIGTTTHPQEVHIDLPRYSWSVLGRMLVRACRDGSDFHRHHRHDSRRGPQSTPRNVFGSPLIVMQLSPMLALPTRVLGMVCSFLDNGSIWRFEATCRALSVAIISARVQMEEETTKSTDVPKQNEVDGENGSKPSLPQSTTDEPNESKTKIEPKKKQAENLRSRREHSRSSQRLRSQQITSGKKAERASKRKSFDYCFLAATQARTTTEFRAEIQSLTTGNSQIQTLVAEDKRSELQKRKRTISLEGSVDSVLQSRRDISGWSCDSSLSTFVEEFTGRNSGPMGLLSSFLAHIAMHVEDVFTSDPGGTVVLSSCLTSCFELVSKRSGIVHEPVFCFYKPFQVTKSAERSLEGFAMDVLHAELILKQCDKHDLYHVEFDDDANKITLLVSEILEAAEELLQLFQSSQERNIIVRKYYALRARCFWLLSGFYIWRSRVAHTISEVRQAEDEGIAFIEEATAVLKSPVLKKSKVVTPHLVSPGRTELFWKEISVPALTKYRDEIQAASVVSLARQEFQDLVATIKNRSSTDDDVALSDIEARAFSTIGETLFERYKSDYGREDAKHSELVEDFLVSHGDALLTSFADNSMEDGRVDSLEMLSLTRVDRAHLLAMGDSSILSILTVCLSMDEKNQLSVTKLLTCLILSAQDVHSSLLHRIAEAEKTRRGGADDDDFSESDNDSFFSQDGSDDGKFSGSTVDEKKARRCGYFVAYLTRKVSESLSDYMRVENRLNFIATKSPDRIIQTVVGMLSRWFETTARHLFPEDTADQEMLKSTASLVECVLEIASPEEQERVDQIYFTSIARAFIHKRHEFETVAKEQGNRSTRTARQKICLTRAELVSIMATSLADKLTNRLGQVKEFNLLSSSFLSHPTSGLLQEEVKVFLESALYLWKFASRPQTENPVGSSGPAACSSFDRPIAKTLLVPSAMLTIVLCGSASRSRVVSEASEQQIENDQMSLIELFDSDASVNEELFDYENDIQRQSRDRKELLRVICHAVNSIDLIIEKLDDKSARSSKLVFSGKTNLGPLLPLTCTKILNLYADALLDNFADENQEKANLWAEHYPFSTRNIGYLLDSNLHKCYRWLYGFVLVGERGSTQSSSKDLASTISPISEISTADCTLANIASAAQLYRCIVRAYAGGRRTAPKAALELVSSSLPPLIEDDKTAILKRFLFDAEGNDITTSHISNLIEKKAGWDAPFDSIRKYLVPSESDRAQMSMDDDDIMRIRRGILGVLAEGPLPLTHDAKSKGDTSPDDDRLHAVAIEEEISKKFGAIFDDLCLGDTLNSEGWYRAAQCMTTKAEVIADRLGLSKGFSRADDFNVPSAPPPVSKGVPIDELLLMQSDEESEIDGAWVHHVGSDLSAYVRFSWSSFESLRACSVEIAKTMRTSKSAIAVEDTASHREALVWRHLRALDQHSEYVRWQEGWGGIFVSALRKLALRILSVAIFTMQCRQKLDTDDKGLISELCESLGIVLYSDLMGSQNYGFPMRPMGLKRKRELATVAGACFRAAADVLEAPVDSAESDEDQATWDLLFMAGKCEEKIAKTYQMESFPTGPGEKHPRRFEKHLASALSHYSIAYSQAKKIEDDGGSIGEQSGGSAHGSTEVLYRIHATRLKCLIKGIRRHESELLKSQEEALRLAERHWFNAPDNMDETNDQHIRDRIWQVLSDVVAGLAQCRLNHAFFHRSVYRHAQALMWSPLFYNPTCTEGSLGHVPATRSFQIRGLNSATPVVQSAEVVMNGLFDKKRSQLCAVWVTTTTGSSPFQILNNSTRKYDSLRGKYVSAYLDTLRLSHRRAQIETFLKWTSTCKRDHPNYFQASALQGGGIPAKNHMTECLVKIHNNLTENAFLLGAKRQANSAFADCLVYEISTKLNRSSDRKKAAELLLKYAYATFLRLNCSVEDLEKAKGWKYGQNSIREVDALCEGFLALGDESTAAIPTTTSFGDWSGNARKSTVFLAALEKCKALFPTLSGNFFSKKASAKSKKNSDDAANDAPPENPAKRKEPEASKEEMVSVSYEVAVPTELSAGESFFTTVKFGDGTKKLKLTVPASNPSSLRFTLQVPKDTATKPPPEKKSRFEDNKTPEKDINVESES